MKFYKLPQSLWIVIILLKERKMWMLTTKVQMDWCGERPFSHRAVCNICL